MSEDSSSDSSEEACIDGLDWTALRQEFTWKNLWTGRSWADIGKHFVVVLLLGLIPSGYDVVSDGLLVNAFVNGTYYIKHVTHNLSQHLPGEEYTPEEDCRHIGSFYENIQNGTVVKYEKVECFEKDPIWGWTTFVIMLLPGLLGGYQVQSSACILQSKIYRGNFAKLI